MALGYAEIGFWRVVLRVPVATRVWSLLFSLVLDDACPLLIYQYFYAELLYATNQHFHLVRRVDWHPTWGGGGSAMLAASLSCGHQIARSVIRL